MTIAEIEQLLAPTIEAMGYEITDLELKIGGRSGLLRVFIDSPEGIGVDDCEKVSNQISGILDVEDPIPGEYSLEVSSPGLDRRLRRAADFERFAGYEVKISLVAPRDGRRRYRGRLNGIESDTVSVTVDNVDYALPLNEIEMARLVPVL